MPNEPLTVTQVRDILDVLIHNHPEYGNLPVHILDMEDYDGPETIYDGLVTAIDIDCFSQEQGLVVAFFAWRNEPECMNKYTNKIKLIEDK